MGHEMTGEVLDGADGSRIRRGDRVLVDPVLFCGTCFDCRAGRTNLCPNGAVIGREVNGGFADFVVAPRSHVYPLPPSIDSRTAPLIQVLTTVLHAQRRASVGRISDGRDPPNAIGRRHRPRRLRTIARAAREGARRGPGHRRHAQRVEAQRGRAAGR